MTDAISALGIEKREGAMEKEYNYNDRKYIEVPNVVDLTVKEAVSNLKNFKVEFSGSGNTVSYQSPSSGERILEGETVKLLLKE